MQYKSAGKMNIIYKFIVVMFLVIINIWIFFKVKTVEEKIKFINPSNFEKITGKVVKQKKFTPRMSDFIYIYCKNNCLSQLRFTKIQFENDPKYYYLNGELDELVVGEVVQIYYDQEKKMFPKGEVNSFGLFINETEKIPMLSKRDRDSKEVYVCLIFIIFADIVGVVILICEICEKKFFKRKLG